MKNCGYILLLWLWCVSAAASPVTRLLERIDKGASKKFVIELTGDTDSDYFELDRSGRKVVVRGNNYISVAAGIHWYLKYYAHIHLSWNNMQARLPDMLPPVPVPERHETGFRHRYYLNYCTYSYSMAFWDWERWECEIDWMALHGIDMPLALVGTDVVWYNVLQKLGYDKPEIDAFIAGPAFQAWWLMNNLEGWGGPNPDSWYRRREALQKKILRRMREYGMNPVFPGYSGMVPSDAKERLGLDVQNPGQWCGFRRPAFLQPSDAAFQEIADLYYREQTRLFGAADYYSMDPFHEGGNTEGVDLAAAGQAIMAAMKRHRPGATWVIQAWGGNPRPEMIDALPAGSLLVLDLSSESQPQWGDTASGGTRPDGFGGHDWLWCMLLNYGGNVGLHGKMQHVADAFFQAKDSPFGQSLCGMGLTMEGIENNPVMYELVCELVWHDRPIDRADWLRDYTVARYGQADTAVQQAWEMLARSIYDCPPLSRQQGTHESIFCARPSADVRQVSSWAAASDYYDPDEVIRAAASFLSAADKFRDNDNYNYDLVDILRQAVAEKGRQLYASMQSAIQSADAALFETLSRQFLRLILLQDELLNTRSEFRLEEWIARSRRWGDTVEEKNRCEWNARTQITTWGNRSAADAGGLHDYAHREWSGLLRTLYYTRWQLWCDNMASQLRGGAPVAVDWYAVESQWCRETTLSPAVPGDGVETARRIAREVFGW
ncbi:MAG: alpha-N-acetylglucosaminidase [Coprobacter sp.]|nr:alpha-N-acetylglucosaminidase [Coprobacter sp.]